MTGGLPCLYHDLLAVIRFVLDHALSFRQAGISCDSFCGSVTVVCNLDAACYATSN